MSKFHTNFQDYYSEEDISNVKDQLQRVHRVRLFLRPANQQQEAMKGCKALRCHNTHCLFEFVYAEVSPKRYALLNSFSMHLNECELEPEEILFEETKKKIISLKSRIYQIMYGRFPDYGLESPGKILQLLEEAGLFGPLYNGFTSMDIRRRIKKKFDNIVAEEKRRMIFNLRQEKSKQQKGDASPSLKMEKLPPTKTELVNLLDSTAPRSSETVSPNKEESYHNRGTETEVNMEIDVALPVYHDESYSD